MAGRDSGAIRCFFSPRIFSFIYFSVDGSGPDKVLGGLSTLDQRVSGCSVTSRVFLYPVFSMLTNIRSNEKKFSQIVIAFVSGAGSSQPPDMTVVSIFP
jgi:hypothetical protein